MKLAKSANYYNSFWKIDENYDEVHQNIMLAQSLKAWNQDYKKNIQFFNIQLTPIKDRRIRFILE